MRALLLSGCFLFAGCTGSEPMPEAQLRPLLHADFKVPDCASFDESQRSWTDHKQTDEGYLESIDFTGSSACLDSWLLSVNDAQGEVPSEFLIKDDDGYRMIMRVNEEAAPKRDRLFIQWLHSAPLAGVKYWDGRKKDD